MTLGPAGVPTGPSYIESERGNTELSLGSRRDDRHEATHAGRPFPLFCNETTPQELNLRRKFQPLFASL